MVVSLWEQGAMIRQSCESVSWLLQDGGQDMKGGTNVFPLWGVLSDDTDDSNGRTWYQEYQPNKALSHIPRFTDVVTSRERVFVEKHPEIADR